MHNLQKPQNTRFLWTRFHVQERPSSIGVLQPYFKSSEGISCTGLCHGVLTRFAVNFFSYDSLNVRKWRNDYRWATYEDNFSRVLNQEFFFWFTSSRFCKQPVLLEVLAPMSLFLQGIHMRREYRKRTTLCSKSSAIKGLLCAPDPDKCMKGMLISPNYCTSHPRRFCAVGDVVTQRYDILWDWLWDACHMAGVRWESCCEWFCSEEDPHYRLEQSASKLS